jgi:hypothetical protein
MDYLIIGYMANLFKWANVFISLFIILIAYSFFQRTKPHNNRTPWIILFVAVITFFIFETSNALFPNLNPILELRDFFKTLFVAFILYVFVYERYLIEHSKAIIIESKDDKLADDKNSSFSSELKVENKPAGFEKKENSAQQVTQKRDSADISSIAEESASEKYVDPEFLPPQETIINPNDPLLRVTLREEAPKKKQVKKSKPIKKKKPSKK